MTTKTKIRNSIAALAVTVTALSGFAGMASAAAPAPTKVLIEAESGGFFGYVKSPKLRCKSERTVVLFKQLGSKQDPRNDQRVGMDTRRGQQRRLYVGHGQPRPALRPLLRPRHPHPALPPREQRHAARPAVGRKASAARPQHRPAADGRRAVDVGGPEAGEVA